MWMMTHPLVDSLTICEIQLSKEVFILDLSRLSPPRVRNQIERWLEFAESSAPFLRM
jgi:hypothetical protein